VDDPREEAMKSWRRYKNGWVGLGKWLTKIQSQELWKDWGHDSFMKYCKEELDLTPMTTKDMMVAYNYIKENQPSSLNTLETDENAYVPDFNTVSSICKAEHKGTLQCGKSDDLFNELFEEGKKPSEVRKNMKDYHVPPGDELMAGIRKQTNKVKRDAKKLNKLIHETSSFEDDVRELSDQLVDKVEGTSIIKQG
jgi:hypothetical protein